MRKSFQNKTKVPTHHDVIPQNKVLDIIFYKTDNDGNIKIEVLLHDESLWLTQAKNAELFDEERPAITKH